MNIGIKQSLFYTLSEHGNIFKGVTSEQRDSLTIQPFYFGQ